MRIKGYKEETQQRRYLGTPVKQIKAKSDNLSIFDKAADDFVSWAVSALKQPFE